MVTRTHLNIVLYVNCLVRSDECLQMRNKFVPIKENENERACDVLVKVELREPDSVVARVASHVSSIALSSDVPNMSINAPGLLKC
jgi:hypothetical protein